MRVFRKRFWGLSVVAWFLLLGGAGGTGNLSGEEPGASSGAESLGVYAEHPEIKKFITFMVEKHDFSVPELESIFEKLPIDKKWEEKLIGYTNRAPEAKMNWNRYRKQFLTSTRIEGGVKFWEKHRKKIRQIRKRYGIPEEIVIATLGMESFYGRYTGKLSVLRSLTTFVAEKGRRHKFYFRELEHFLRYCKQNGYDPFSVNGSYSGAMGPAQFIPTSAFYYARDGDGDKKVNLFTNFDDILNSIGHYYAKCGWKKGRPVAKRVKNVSGVSANSTEFPKKQHLFVKSAGKQEHWRLYPNYQILRCYNNSHLYALTLFQLGIKTRHLYEEDRKTQLSD